MQANFGIRHLREVESRVNAARINANSESYERLSQVTFAIMRAYQRGTKAARRDAIELAESELMVGHKYRAY